MDISFIALDRIFENHMAKDRRVYDDAVAKGKGVVSFGRKMTDDELLAKLRSFGIMLDRGLFAELRPGFLSAEDLSTWFIKDRRLTLDDIDDDWLWVCLTVLWERWFPDSPSFEMIDDAIQEGYKKADDVDASGAVEIWLPVWKQVSAIMDAQGMKTVHDFDRKFRGSQSVFNWVQDVEMELGNAGLGNSRYFQERIQFCEEVIPRFQEEEELTIENMRRALAESHFRIGDYQKADVFFSKWLHDDPQWGWGWIGWSDCYWLPRKERFDLGRAEEILKRGLAVAGVRDKVDVYERLMNLYEDMGRKEDADRIQEELEREDDALQDGELSETTDVSVHDNVLSVKTKVRYGGMGMPLEEWQRSMRQPSPVPAASKKTGRNEPCPCGSGKKYKKCCGG